MILVCDCDCNLIWKNGEAAMEQPVKKDAMEQRVKKAAMEQDFRLRRRR